MHIQKFFVYEAKNLQRCVELDHRISGDFFLPRILLLTHFSINLIKFNYDALNYAQKYELREGYITFTAIVYYSTIFSMFKIPKFRNIR